MAVEIFVAFLSEVVRFLSATVLWCGIAQVAASYFGVTRIQDFSVTAPIRYVGAAGGAIVVVGFDARVCAPHGVICREITTIASDGKTTPIQIRMPLGRVSNWTAELRGSDGFVVSGKDWWYVTLDERDGVAATTFVKSDGTRKTEVRPTMGVPPYGPFWWTVAVRGADPRVLELTAPFEATPQMSPETTIRELDWSGTSRLWHLPSWRTQWPS